MKSSLSSASALPTIQVRRNRTPIIWYTMTQAGGAPPAFFMETVPSSESHAFSLWGEYLNDHQTLNFTVRDRVIAFFKQYLYN